MCASGAAVQASHPATIKLTHYPGYEATFSGANYPQLATKVSDPHSFASQYAGWDIPSVELQLIGRSVGAAILNRIEGKGPTAFLEIYKAGGGNNQRTVHELTKIQSHFKK
jgi:hypothetical protein